MYLGKKKEYKDEKLDDTLKSIFSNINDWLKFAETKNGLIIGFNSTLGFNLVKSIVDYKVFDNFDLSKSFLVISTAYIFFSLIRLVASNKI